ncbi:MAG: hypothetical protein VKP57_07110 [Candidatus Sericytochromatia bacterium]|nr:hypothetical protein [Candidatus Sericytochromatia bacterium]
MKSRQPIDRILRERELSFVLEDAYGIRGSLDISIPDLRCAPRSLSGEWGPCHTLDVPEESPIVVVARWQGGTPVSAVLAGPRKVQLESPMLASTRARYPLYLDLPLPGTQRRIWVYFDPLGFLGPVTVTPNSDNPLYRDDIRARTVEPGGNRSWFLACVNPGTTRDKREQLSLQPGQPRTPLPQSPSSEQADRFASVASSYASAMVGESKWAELLERESVSLKETPLRESPEPARKARRLSFARLLATPLMPQRGD